MTAQGRYTSKIRACSRPVSYTHLDVYKRQLEESSYANVQRCCQKLMTKHAERRSEQTRMSKLEMAGIDDTELALTGITIH